MYMDPGLTPRCLTSSCRVHVSAGMGTDWAHSPFTGTQRPSPESCGPAFPFSPPNDQPLQVLSLSTEQRNVTEGESGGLGWTLLSWTKNTTGSVSL